MTGRATYTVIVLMVAALASACAVQPRVLPDPKLVASTDGVRIAVRDTGRSNAPSILFIHGFAQDSSAWQRQFRSSLANRHRLVAMDLRGHGTSDQPLAAQRYARDDQWAEDVHTVMKAAGLQRPVLIGWSFGARVVMDYVARYGTEEISGIVFVGGYLLEDTDVLGAALLESFPSMLNDDPEICAAGTRMFLSAAFAKPPAADVLASLYDASMRVTPQLRRNVVGRPMAFESILSQLQVPVLLIHGQQDRLILPLMSERVAALVGGAQIRSYADSGHAPFIEAAARFNRDLAAFVRQSRR